MKKDSFTMTEKVSIYPSEKASWYLVPITRKIGQEIKEKYGKAAKGFGSLKVEVTLGKSVWQTSIFPDKYSGSYILFLKAKVRKAEDIEAGEKVKFKIKLI